MSSFVTATLLDRWSIDRRAQGELPLLVRKLILASLDPVAMDFPGGDSVSRPGYDGLLRLSDGNSFAPAGQSAWEMSAEADPRSKANRDYQKRTNAPGHINQPATAFVFVTSRRWPKKAEWADEKAAEGIWSTVRALDADDLEQWIDVCPAVGVWARRLIAGLPEGIQDLEEIWDGWQKRTTPRLSPSLLTAGRESEVIRLRDWIGGPPSRLRVQGNTIEEVLGFFAAAAKDFDPPLREKAFTRTVHPWTPDAWRAVAGLRTPTILIATPELLPPGWLPSVDNHHVIVAYGNRAAGIDADVRLPRLKRSEIENALRDMGVEEDRAQRIALESKGQLAALIDLLGGGIAPPPWAAPEVASQLLPFFIAGRWCENVNDYDALCRLSGTSEHELRSRLARWSNEADAPVRLIGGMWQWIARKRAWPYLGRYLLPSDLKALETIANEVLGENDPRLNLAPDQRWLAALRNCSPRYSEPLRKGIAEFLAVLATEAESTPSLRDAIECAARIVRGLFGETPSPERWYSLAPVLSLLAEAAPDAFLASVERDCVGSADVRAVLFQEQGYFGGSQHHYLLWALETLAWSPDFLGRATNALAGLAENDPGGKSGNRPRESLRNIFVPWHPHTAAPAAARLAVLDSTHKRYPDVMFRLCLELIPHRGDSASPAPRPRWRNWADEADEDADIGYDGFVEGLFERLQQWAEDSEDYWAELVGRIRNVPRDRLPSLIERLESVPLETIAAARRDILRTAIRRVIHDVQTIPQAFPELSADDVSRFGRIYARLELADPVDRDYWLFDRKPALLSIGSEDGWEQQQKVIAATRLKMIHNLGGDTKQQLLRLVERVEDLPSLGFAVGQSALPHDVIKEIIGHLCESGGQRNEAALSGLVWGIFKQHGWDRVTDFASRFLNWTSAQKALFASLLPCESRTWDWIEQFGEDAASQYWTRRNQWLTDPNGDARRAIETLIARSRPFAAFDLAVQVMQRKEASGTHDPELLLKALRAITDAATTEERCSEQVQLSDDFGYHLGELLAAIEAGNVTNEDEIGRFEWVWLKPLIYAERGPSVLRRALATDPAFFAKAIATVYLATDLPQSEQKVADNEPTKTSVEHAGELIQEWHGVPGLSESKELNCGVLHRWVRETRELLRKSGHLGIGDQKIGAVLARAPMGEDGIWPHECVRQLIEEVQSEDLDRGLFFGAINQRGASIRFPDEGGDQERNLSAKYERARHALSGTCPRTSEILRQLIHNYADDAQREDDRRDLREYWS